MLKIRLQRVGKKNSPSYRVVLAEHTAPPQGKFIEILGHYNPRKKEKGFRKERIEHWLSKGAQLSPTVYNLLVDEGILKGIKIKAWRPKKKAKEEAKEVPESEKKGEEKVEERPKEEEEKPEEKAEEKPKEVAASPEDKKVEEAAKEPEPEKKEEKNPNQKRKKRKRRKRLRKKRKKPKKKRKRKKKRSRD